jgi:hypothetical protein
MGAYMNVRVLIHVLIPSNGVYIGVVMPSNGGLI